MGEVLADPHPASHSCIYFYHSHTFYDFTLEDFSSHCLNEKMISSSERVCDSASFSQFSSSESELANRGALDLQVGQGVQRQRQRAARSSHSHTQCIAMQFHCRTASN